MKILPSARRHIIIECCGIYEEYDYLPPESIRYVEALKRRFEKAELLTEFVFSSPEQAYAAAKTLFPTAAERVRQQNRAAIPERIGIFFD